MIKVFHRQVGSLSQPTLDEIMTGYDLVALIPLCWAPDGLSKAFAMSQHDESENSWVDNDGVIALRKDIRSTMVGDILISDDVAYLIEKTGFSELTVFSALTLATNPLKP